MFKWIGRVFGRVRSLFRRRRRRSAVSQGSTNISSTHETISPSKSGLYGQINDMSGSVSKRIDMMFKILKEHMRHYEIKVRLLKKWLKHSDDYFFFYDKRMKQEVERVGKEIKIEVRDDQIEKKSIIDILEELKKNISAETSKRTPGTKWNIIYKNMYGLSVPLDRLLINLRLQLKIIEKCSKGVELKGFETELENLIREEGRILFDIEAPALEEVRKRVFVTIHGAEIRTGNTQNIKAEEYAKFNLTEGLEPCQKKDFFVDEIAGTIYAKDLSSPPEKAVMILPGFHGSRKLYDVFCKAVANEGYLAYAIDLPSHGDSGGYFNVALTSEWVLKAMRILKGYFGVKRIGLIGHSTGGIAAMYALAGYNRDVEARLFNIFETYGEFLQHEYSKMDEDTKTDLAMVFYEKIIGIIFDSIK